MVKADEQHLDVDVEVGRFQETWRVEDVVGDAGQTQRPNQMNSLVSSKTKKFEKIEESLKPLCVVEDLNDDEVIELCTLSNEFNACETTTTLIPPKFASSTRLGLREGFAVDLTTASGTSALKMTEQNSDECKIELDQPSRQRLFRSNMPSPPGRVVTHALRKKE